MYDSYRVASMNSKVAVLSTVDYMSWFCQDRVNFCSLGGKQRRISPSFSLLFPLSGLLKQLLRILYFPWMLRKAFSCCYVAMTSQRSPHLLRVRREISGKVIQRSVPMVDSYECHRMWEKNGPVFGKFSALWFESSPQNNRMLVKWQDICKENAEATPERSNLLQCAGSWLLFMDTVWYWTAPSGGGGGNQTNRHCGHSNWAKAEGQSVAAGPVQKEKSKTKSICIVRDEEEAGPSQQEEEAGPEITWSISWTEPWD